MRAVTGLAALSFGLASCVVAGSDDVVAAPPLGPATTDASEVTIAQTSTVEPEPDLFRIAPAGAALSQMIRYGPDGVFHPTRHLGDTRTVDGPVSIARDAFLTGIVFQRSGDDRQILGSVKEKLVLVAAENETMELVGIRTVPSDGNSSHILYTSRITSTPEATIETLRSYNRVTKEVTEILETGGWESSTDFSYVSGDWAVGRWSGEGFFRFDIVNVITGEIRQSFPAEGECVEGELGGGCLPFTVTALMGQKMYGFGPSRNDDGVVDSMTLFELDTRITQPIPLVSFPWTDGLYYPNDIWVNGSGSAVVVGLSTTPDPDDGQPLAALIYNTETEEVHTTPQPGYFHRAVFN